MYKKRPNISTWNENREQQQHIIIEKRKNEKRKEYNFSFFFIFCTLTVWLKGAAFTRKNSNNRKCRRKFKNQFCVRAVLDFVPSTLALSHSSVLFFYIHTIVHFFFTILHSTNYFFNGEKWNFCLVLL